MKNFFRVSALAAVDIDEIWFYIAEDNPDAADKFTRKLTAQFSKLATMPEIGRTREELSHELRSLPVGRYIIFYRPNENGIEIVRVLHGARNLPSLFE